jgi:hypothetical protein
MKQQQKQQEKQTKEIEADEDEEDDHDEVSMQHHDEHEMKAEHELASRIHSQLQYFRIANNDQSQPASNNAAVGGSTPNCCKARTKICQFQNSSRATMSTYQSNASANRCIG